MAYATTSCQTDEPIRAYRVASEPDAIWFQSGNRIALKLSASEVQTLIAELRRELAAVEAAARGAAA